MSRGINGGKDFMFVHSFQNGKTRVPLAFALEFVAYAPLLFLLNLGPLIAFLYAVFAFFQALSFSLRRRFKGKDGLHIGLSQITNHIALKALHHYIRSEVLAYLININADLPRYPYSLS
jgi:cobalamin synthase